MPTYDFQCSKCRNRFAVARPMNARGSVPCPKCKSRDTRQVPSAFYAKTIRKS